MKITFVPSPRWQKRTNTAKSTMGEPCNLHRTPLSLNPKSGAKVPWISYSTLYAGRNRTPNANSLPKASPSSANWNAPNKPSRKRLPDHGALMKLSHRLFCLFSILALLLGPLLGYIVTLYHVNAGYFLILAVVLLTLGYEYNHTFNQ